MFHSAGSNSSSQYSIQAFVGNANEQGEGSSNQANGNGSTTNSTQKNGQQVGYRRHRNGRRRAGETRLRESQSLNRITEVQESESPLTLAAQNQLAANQAQNKTSSTAIAPSLPPIPIATNTKPSKMGFSARLFHGFRKSDSHTTQTNDNTQVPSRNDETCTINTNTKNSTSTTSINSSSVPDDVEVPLGSELAKAIKVTAESKSSAAAKKLKLLGKYFQVFSSCLF